MIELNMNKFYYLTGMPRTGSTLLGSLLAQHPDVHISATSPLNKVMHDLWTSIQNNGLMGGDWNVDDMNDRIFKWMFHCWYSKIDKKYIFDKSRGWGMNLIAIKGYINPHPKVLLTIRPVPDIITSFITLFENDNKNFVDVELYKAGKEINTTNRALEIWSRISYYGYESTKMCLEHYRDIIHIVNYDDLVSNTTDTMQRIWNYLEIESPQHNFENVQTYLKVPDENWGVKDLHIVRPRVEKTSRNSKEVLGEELYNMFSEFNLK